MPTRLRIPYFSLASGFSVTGLWIAGVLLASAALAQNDGDAKDVVWGEAVDGLRFRLLSERKTFEAWELPRFELQIRNEGEPLTAEQLQQRFRKASWRLLFQDRHRRAPNPNRWVVAGTDFDISKLPPIKRNGVHRTTITLADLRESSSPKWAPYALAAGRYTIGLGQIGGAHPRDKFVSNTLTLKMLPPGVKNEKELATYLKPLTANKHRIRAGFVPNRTEVVWGEPMFVTFVVENLEETPFQFGFGGDYRGTGRHDRFKIEVRGPANEVPDPLAVNGGPFDRGGIMMIRTAQARDAAVETVPLKKYRAIAGPGEYSVVCRFRLEPPWKSGKKAFETLVETRFKLTILPREPENVQRVLKASLAQARRTNGGPLKTLVETVGSFGAEQAVDGLAKMMADGDPEHRAAAAYGLGRIERDEARDALLRADRDTSADVRSAMIEALGAFADEEAVTAVILAFGDKDERVRGAAVRSLGRMKTDTAVQGLILYLRDHPNDGAMIMTALGESKSAEAFTVVEAALAGAEDGIRAAAAEAIVNFPKQQAAQALRRFVDHEDLDFRELVIRKLAGSLKEPIEAEWLIPVIKSRRKARSIGDAPRLLRLYTRDQAAPALLRCLEFDNPAVRNYYHSTIMDNQLACGGLAIPWHADLNRDGSQKELDENRETLRALKKWVDHHVENSWSEPLKPWRLDRAAEEQTWGKLVDGLKIRTHVNRSIWPEGLPQVLIIEAMGDNGGSVTLKERPSPLEVEVNGVIYRLPADADLKVTGNWSAYHSHTNHNLQLDERWRRKSDGAPLILSPGKYTVRARLSIIPKFEQTGLAVGKPTKFEVIATK